MLFLPARTRRHGCSRLGCSRFPEGLPGGSAAPKDPDRKKLIPNAVHLPAWNEILSKEQRGLTLKGGSDASNNNMSPVPNYRSEERSRAFTAPNHNRALRRTIENPVRLTAKPHTTTPLRSSAPQK
jgi:hypothetical protein